jgi:hypothetical protein
VIDALVAAAEVSPEGAHDHVWRRLRYDIATDVVGYGCDLCGATWSGPRIAPWQHVRSRTPLPRG